MRKFSVVALGLLSSLFLWGKVLAVPWVWTDNIGDDQYIQTDSPYHYVHHLYGFNPGKDLLSNYNVEIALYDDTQNDERERAFINLPGTLADGFYNFKYDNNTYGFSLLGWFQLQLSGMLDVCITATKGDFNFDYSHLTASGCESEPYSVTEPGAMMVLGLGLFGLAGCARKRFKG